MKPDFFKKFSSHSAEENEDSSQSNKADSSQSNKADSSKSNKADSSNEDSAKNKKDFSQKEKKQETDGKNIKKKEEKQETGAKEQEASGKRQEADAKNGKKWKDWGILAAWVAGILLLSGALWFGTQPLRNRLLQETVNELLGAMGYTRNLAEAVPREQLVQDGVPLGTWYTVSKSDDWALVFALTAEGIRLPCVAFVSGAGRVDEIILLNTRMKPAFSRLPRGVAAAYIRRIERDVPYSREEL
ncbi:MAG: hypothetical protein LBG87_03460 [Spirochaetaceae bacterium]|jgi:hypothetical protein|nr:hypothetical protein [Spirochaetaceae bacterium]